MTNSSVGFPQFYQIQQILDRFLAMESMMTFRAKRKHLLQSHSIIISHLRFVLLNPKTLNRLAINAPQKLHKSATCYCPKVLLACTDQFQRLSSYHQRQ